MPLTHPGVTTDVAVSVDKDQLQQAAAHIRATFRQAALDGINEALALAGAKPITADNADATTAPPTTAP